VIIVCLMHNYENHFVPQSVYVRFTSLSSQRTRTSEKIWYVFCSSVTTRFVAYLHYIITARKEGRGERNDNRTYKYEEWKRREGNKDT
jgi:hypothetical protein